MDTLRNNEEMDEKDVNSQKGVVKVIFIKVFKLKESNHQLQVQAIDATLVSVHEKKEIEAQKMFYEKIRQEMGLKRAKRLAFVHKLSIVYIPSLALAFAILYWILGLRQAEVI